ncbi:MAG: DUF5615 family PIN-like protein [Roseiflexaceae bacterium]
MVDAIQFYADVHVPRSVTLALRRRGVDVLTAQDVSMELATDEEHLAHATTAGRVLVTQDADFLALHASGITHSGIAYARQGTPIGDMVRGLLLIFDVLIPDEMLSQVEFL